LENREDLNSERSNPTAPVPDNLQQSTRAGLPPGPASDQQQSTRAGLPPAPPPDLDDPEVADGSLTLKQWLIANSVSLIIVAGLFALLLWKFDFAGILAIAIAALGLSFVVFLHELGHFVVAKWCDVEVTTFSIGFGPAIPGCAWQWGETTYKLSLIPVGGYVQMVGQVDGDEGSDGSEDNPRSYRNKTVGQRMAIISAGVIMNVILAVVVFIVVYEGPGKERAAAVVGPIDTGAPAFRYGLHPGSLIKQVGNVKDPSFEDIVKVVMSSRSGEQIALAIDGSGGAEQQFKIEPRLDKNDKKPMFGIGMSKRLELQSRKGLESGWIGPFWPGTAAARAEPALEYGDRIVACSDPDAPGHAVTPLPPDPRFVGEGRYDFFAFERRMKLLAAEKVTLEVERQDHETTRLVKITVEPMFGRSLGLRMQMGQISVIRIGSPAEKAELKARDLAGSREGDVIEAVEVLGADGKVMRFAGEALDPVRLPFQLNQWYEGLVKAGISADDRAERKVTLMVRRHRAVGGEQYVTEKVLVNWDDNWRFDDTVPMSVGAPMAIPELGLAYQIKTIVAGVDRDVIKDNPLQSGDVIKSFRYTATFLNGEPKTQSWPKNDLEEGDWARVASVLNDDPMQITEIELRIERGKETREVKLTPAEDRNRPLSDRGWLLMTDTRRQKADNFRDAIALGMRDTVDGMWQVFQNLRGIITGRVSIDNIGGPAMIAHFAYKFAGYDFWEYVFFLGMISVNLAVVNFLPIPVLDGGHMVFLIYEKLRGRPASETVRVAATYAGLAMILSLFLFVTFNDIRRFFF
jgi:regulator of sigma E protease